MVSAAYSTTNDSREWPIQFPLHSLIFTTHARRKQNERWLHVLHVWFSKRWKYIFMCDRIFVYIIQWAFYVNCIMWMRRQNFIVCVCVQIFPAFKRWLKIAHGCVVDGAVMRFGIFWLRMPIGVARYIIIIRRFQCVCVCVLCVYERQDELPVNTLLYVFFCFMRT